MPGKRISDRRSHSLTRYLKEIPAYRSPSPEAADREEGEINSDEGKNPEELILSNLFFVVKIAGEYRNRGVPFEDLLNEGNIGLMQAASRYDHSKGVRFRTYAVWWIRKSLRTALDDQGSTIRVPDYQRRKAARLKADDEADQAKHGHHAPDRRCADCGPPLQPAGLHRISLDDDRGDDRRGVLLDSLADQRAPDPIREMMNREAAAGLQQGISHLTRTEREVIERRFGLSGEEARTLKDIGAMLSLSRERIRQIEVQAKEKLRTYLSRAPARTQRRQAD
ncbi:MAG TPA: sigma-70 family RNA polymerase sigma factor [Candidatus Polarisedimenticolia bacterium]|jgi:RNA polymerase primary sigma factor